MKDSSPAELAGGSKQHSEGSGGNTKDQKLTGLFYVVMIKKKHEKLLIPLYSKS